MSWIAVKSIPEIPKDRPMFLFYTRRLSLGTGGFITEIKNDKIPLYMDLSGHHLTHYWINQGSKPEHGPNE